MRFKHCRFSIFCLCKKIFAQQVDKPKPGSQRPCATADLNQSGTKKCENNVEVLIFVALALIQANS